MYKKNEKTLAKATAELFMQHVWSRKNSSINIILDRRSQFVVKIWDSLCKLLGIRAKLSMVWHLKTDGQSKIANQKMEQYLKSYVNYFQDDWVCLLLMAKFASNSNSSTLIKVPSFLASWSYLPQMSFELVDLSANLTRKRLTNI